MTNRKRWLSAGLSMLFALAFALVFYSFNTPLGPSVGSDNAIYLTMGTAMARGYAPYTEIFDHKGPLLFILQAIPQAIAGGYSTLAVFVQQVVFLFACLRVIDAIASRMGVRCTEAAQLTYIALLASLVGGGNLTEEYTNLFTLLGLYIILRVFDRPLEGRTGRSFFIPAAALGALTMLCLLTRANNALPVCGMIAALSIVLLAQRRFAALGWCALGMAAGCALTALPVVLWLWAHGALSQAFYGSIIHNMMYSETAGESRLLKLLTSSYGHYAIFMAAMTCLGALALLIRTRRIALPLAMAAGAAMGGLAAFISHKYYPHYLVLSAPASVMGMCALLAEIERPGGRRRLTGLAFVMLLCAARLAQRGSVTNAWRLSERVGAEEFDRQAQALYALVPEEERDRFMAYRVEPKWYVSAEALPCMRFYFLQETLAQADPAVMDEIVAEFESDPPKWLVIYYNREFGPPYDPRVAQIFEEDYEFVDAQGQYQLRRLKEADDE